LTDLASIARDKRRPWKTLAVIFVLALITIAFEIYSDAALTTLRSSPSVPDPATAAIAHASNTVKRAKAEGIAFPGEPE